MKHKRNSFIDKLKKVAIYTVLLLTVAGIFLLSVIGGVLMVNNPTSKNILTNFILNDGSSMKKFDKETQDAIILLSEKSIIFSKKEIFDGVIGYYNTLVTFLFGLIAMATLFTFIYIKRKSEAQINREIKKFFEGEDIQKIFHDEVKRVKDEYEEYVVAYGKYTVAYEEILKRLDVIDEYIEILENQDISIMTPEETNGRKTWQ